MLVSPGKAPKQSKHESQVLQKTDATEKKHLTLIEILIMVYYNPYITGYISSPVFIYTKQPSSFHCSYGRLATGLTSPSTSSLHGCFVGFSSPLSIQNRDTGRRMNKTGWGMCNARCNKDLQARLMIQVNQTLGCLQRPSFDHVEV